MEADGHEVLSGGERNPLRTFSYPKPELLGEKDLEDLLELFSDDQTFLDVGANYGFYNFLVSRTGANCIAVEPTSEFRSRHLHNKNRLVIYIKVLHKAFYRREAGGVGMDKLQLNRQKKGKVDLVRCDKIIESRDLETPDSV